jgi:hypothetical protein
MAEKECGRTWCRDGKGELTPGPSSCGDKRSVSISVRCPTGSRPAAILHNHPSGDIRCSGQDLKASAQHKIPVCVKIKGGQTKCYQPRKRG